MSDVNRVIQVNDREHALMVNGLNSFRISLEAQNKPTEDIEDLLLKVIDAPAQKEKRWFEREAR